MPEKKEFKTLVAQILDNSIKFKDLKPEELKALPTIKALVSAKESRRSGSTYFQITYKIHDKLKITKQLTESEYNVICLDFPKEHQMGGKEFIVNVPVIPTEGKYTDDQNYYRLQIGLGKTVYQNFFLDDTDIRLLNEFPHNLQFVYREKKINKSDF